MTVDDEENFREIFQSLLTSAGYHVETATNGQEGIVKAKALKPDLILMDVKMPIMDGAQAAMALREDPETKDVKIVFLTSLGSPDSDMQDFDRKFAQDFGVQDYIKKTDNLDVVAQKVHDFLAKQK